jgi:hypothetical protein
MSILSVRTIVVHPWELDAFVADAGDLLAGCRSSDDAAVTLHRVVSGAPWGTFELHLRAADLDGWRQTERSLDGAGGKAGLAAACENRLAAPVEQRLDHVVSGPDQVLDDVRYFGVARGRVRMDAAEAGIGRALALAGLVEAAGGYRSLVSVVYFGQYVGVQHVGCHSSLAHLESTWQTVMADPAYTKAVAAEEHAVGAVPHTMLLERVC